MELGTPIRTGIALALAIGCAACGGGGDAPGADAGSTGDAAIVADAAMIADAGPRADAAMLPDAGPEPECDPLAGSPTWTVLAPGLAGLETPSATPGYETQFAGLLGVAYGNGRFVAIGNAIATQAIRWATSEDGTTWTEHEQPTDIADTTFSVLSKIRFANGRFVFFAALTNEPWTSTNGGGFVYSSEDGASWTGTRIGAGGLSVTEFDSSSSLTVTAGRDGDLRSSADLSAWASLTVPQEPGFSFNDVAYGGGRWVATINGGGEVFGSVDGATWTKLDGISGPGGYTVEYGNGVWIAQGRTYRTSADGTTFAETTATGAGFGTAARFAGGRFVSYVLSYAEAGTPAYFRVSTDGVDWQEFGGVPGIGLGGVFSDIAYGRCKYVAAGQYVKDGVRQPLIAVVDAPPHAD